MMKPFFFFCLFGIPVFALAGCTSVGRTMQPTQLSSAVVPIIPTSSMTPTAIVRLSPNTPLPTTTLAPIDTLEPAHAMETLQPLIKEPMNCSVPCFWGIIPGETHLDEARIFFSRLGFTPFEGPDTNPSGMYFYTIEYDSGNGHDSSLTLFASNNLVENIVVSPDIPKQKEGSPREWIAYSPETLIKRYGAPSRVEFTVDDLYPIIGMNMIMFFDKPNLIVSYNGHNMTPKRFCPSTAPFDFVRLWLGHNPPNIPSFETISLEKATSLTITRFTQLMLGDPKKACFAVNGHPSQ